MTYKQKLALRVNEIFHDFEGKKYQEKHEDIFTSEALRWQQHAEKYFQAYEVPITVLDIGTGTGFIPLNTASYLFDNDLFICSDISKEMLDVTQKNISVKDYKCKFKYHKLNGENIGISNVTIITMNSVVHHIPDLEQFFTQIGKIIDPGGRIIIGHEPNKLFYNEKVLLKHYLFFQALSSPKKLITSIVRLIGLTSLLKKIAGNKAEKSKIVVRINEVLIKEKSVKQPLTADEINKMIDYHSPSAGTKIDLTKGIDIEDICQKYLPSFEIEYFESYNYLSKMSNRNALMKRINKSLSERHKGKGATFFVVLKKKKRIHEN